MDEAPDRAVVDLQPTLNGQFGHQPPQREIPCPASRDQPVPVLTRNRPRLVTPHLPGRRTPGLPVALHPLDRAAGSNPEVARRTPAGHPTALDRPNHAITQVHGIGSTHQC